MLLILLLVLFTVDFCQRLLVLPSAQNRNLLQPPLAAYQSQTPYESSQISALAHTWQAISEPPTPLPQKKLSDYNSRQFGDVQLVLLAVYTDDEFTALFRYSSVTEPIAKLLRVKSGQKLQHVEIGTIEPRQVTLIFDGKITVLSLFRPKQNNLQP